MARRTDQDSTDWTAVMARAQVFLCLHYSELHSATLNEQADFLMRFGLPRSEAARLLGTTEDSLRVMARRKKAGGSGKKRAGATRKRSTRMSRGR